ncbi:MAG: hypothetical protein HGB05_03015 [Chloroflexi bacterium]|nr:hypothetical protein [Chloroflexota bacterium]
MKNKLLMSLLVVALLLATVGTAAAAPAGDWGKDGVIGDVKSISGMAFTLTTAQRGDVQVQTTDRTRYRAKDNPDFSLVDLKVGDRVTVQGRWQDGKLQANLVRLIPDELRDKAVGQVKSISGGTIAITKPDGSALSIITNAETKFHAKGIENPSLADIQVGDVIIATGMLDGDTLTASHVGFQTPRERTGPLAVGKIGAINGGTLTLEQPFGQSLTVTTDANTLVVQRGEDGLVVITISDLKVGDGVAVLGVRSSDGKSIAANAIMAGDGAGLGKGLGNRLPRAQQLKLPFGPRN